MHLLRQKDRYSDENGSLRSFALLKKIHIRRENSENGFAASPAVGDRSFLCRRACLVHAIAFREATGYPEEVDKNAPASRENHVAPKSETSRGVSRFARIAGQLQQ